MGPHPEAPVDVQKYIGSCLITQQPRGKRKSGNRHADKDARCASYRGASTVSVCTCCGGTQINKLHCLNNYAWTGIPLISVANARQKFQHRPIPRPLKPVERERLEYAGQSSETSESPSPSGNAAAGFEEILSISQLAIHAQGVPLIISGDNEKSKDKDLRNDLEGYLFKGRDIFLGSSPPIYMMSNSKPAQITSHLYIPDDEISISGESDLKSDTSSSQPTSPSQSDCVSTTSEDSVTSENGLPRIIKPRKRRKKDRRNCESDRDQPNECSGGAAIVTLKPYQPLCYRFTEPGVRKQNSYAKDFDSDITVDYSCRKSVFPKVTHYPYSPSPLCCCPYCVPPPSTFLTPPHSPIESLLTESKKRERLCDVSRMSTMFPGCRDVEVKYSTNNIVSDDLINNFEDICGFQTDPRTVILTSSHPPARPWVELSAKDPSSSCTFTIMCYNVLCDKYATPQMYGYCPNWALKWSYRKKGIMQEIRHYKADILSLQEVETEQFYNFFLPELQKDGYDGIFSPKSRAKTMSENERRHVDGCAIFYQTNKFSLLTDHLVEFNQLAMANAEGSDNMLNRVMTKDNIGLAALLQIKYGAYDKESDSQKSQILLVCTAHIHWDPEYSDVKLIQTMMLMQELHSIVDSALRNNNSVKSLTSDPNDIPLLLCGDFNSLPDSGVVEFLSSGRVAKNHVDFKKFAYTDCLRNLFDSESNEFTHPFKIARAYKENIMPFTNFSYDFKGTIDYVFYSKLHMSVVAVLGPLDQRWLKENNVHGCPHPHVPSDHFPILVELQLFPDPSLNPAISNGVNQHR